jgi:hypothetical protein
VHCYRGLLTALGLAVGTLSGCATAVSRADCYPHIYLDSRYAIRGTSLAAAPTLRDGTCYHFVYQDGRIVRVDYRLDGSLSPDPTSGVATIRVEQSGRAEKRVFLCRWLASAQPGRICGRAHTRRPGQPRMEESGARAAREAKTRVAIFHWSSIRRVTIEESHFGANGQLKADRRLCVAMIRWQYDPDGNTVEESYFGGDTRPTLDRLRGVATIRWQYGSSGSTVEETYLGSDGQLREDKNRGVAIVRWQYDGNRNTLESARADRPRRLALGRSHYPLAIR